ncbi:MAG TPA: dTDP-4-dehydrorhamnose 3,5-epimerase [Caulobacteraceae bacterium]|nr:dTDP-4-dehydrorhamnose 3,5-epimerase [Caulobacteraceae bacterium]
MASVRLIKPPRVGDARGWFSETWSRRAFEALGIEADFRQDNHSYSAPRHVLRGLHFQRPPSGQAKLVRCVRGAIWDVAVDVRAGSPTFGRFVAARLDAENGAQLYIPIGFAHGLLTLEPHTEVLYKVTAFYDPAADSGLAWDDPDFGIPWPLEGATPVLSAKDAALPRSKDFESPFPYDGQPLAELEGA